MENASQYEKIDLSYLKNLMDNNNEIVIEVLNIFKTEVPKDMANLHKHLTEKDYDALGKVAHKLKSSVGNLGLNDLRDEFLFIETSGKNFQHLDKMTEVVTSVTTKMKNVFADIDEEIKRMSA